MRREKGRRWWAVMGGEEGQARRGEEKRREVAARRDRRGGALTSNSIVFGFAMTTACFPSSMRRMCLKASSCEQRAKVSASVNPASASSSRIRSVRRESGCWLPVHMTGATSRGILLKE